MAGEATCRSGESAAWNTIRDQEKVVGIPRPPVTNIFSTQCINEPTSRLVPRAGMKNGWGMTTVDLPLVKVGAVMLKVV